VALGAAGYEVRITGHGAEVQRVLSGLPADGVLRSGDVIVSVDDTPIETTAALLDRIRAHQVGEPVSLSVWRAGEQLALSLPTQPSPTEPTRPAVGITVSTYQFDVQTPFPVDVDSGDVGGPSAGFMFALGIYDAITDGDLTGGNYVAGTGTIGADGTVGPVGGTAEKALAAEQDGADVFLVPQADFDEARRWITRLRVVPVARFMDGVQALCALPSREGTERTLPSVCHDQN
jgi:PDZ domain-containing protein